MTAADKAADQSRGHVFLQPDIQMAQYGSF